MKIFLKIILVLFLAGLLFLTAGFFAVRFGWTNVAGEEDNNSYAYNLISKLDNILPESVSVYGPDEQKNWCKIAEASKVSAKDAKAMFEAYKSSKSSALLDKMLLALELRKGSNKAISACTNQDSTWSQKALEEALMGAELGQSAYTWQNSEYWAVIKEAIIKDQDKINQAATEMGVQPRMLVSVAIVEQLRLYYTQREFYEKFFKPLKILATANKMAWGVMSIKEKMAIQTEEQLLNPNSDFFPGEEYMKVLGSPSTEERYNRLTNEKDHYYSYLYGAAIIKEVQTQWKKAGYDLKYRPEIVATLFNIGFNNSKPKANPVVGGSTLDINGEKYFFGSLAFEFYYSGELTKEFPFK